MTINSSLSDRRERSLLTQWRPRGRRYSDRRERSTLTEHKKPGSAETLPERQT